MRRGAIAGARVVHAAFFLAVSAYSFLSYSPFAYEQFIKPNVVPALTAFVALSPWLFLVAWLLTLLTVMPQLRGGRGAALARAYAIAGGAIGIAVLRRPPLETLGNSGRAFAIGLVALVAPIWLAILDHRVVSAPVIRKIDRRQALAICALTAVAAWAIYAGTAPFRLREIAGIDLPPRALLAGSVVSLAADLVVAAALWLALSLSSWSAKATPSSGAC